MSRNNNYTASRAEQRRYATDSIISVRPQAGSAYNTHQRSRDKTDVPGGKRLWCRLVTAFTFTSVIGGLLIILGAVFISHAHGIHNESGFSLPLVWCVVSIVGGTIMLIGSIILGKLIISNKWKRNEQPQYGRVAPAVQYVHSQSRERTEAVPQMPPSYDQSLQSPIYFIGADGETQTFTVREPPPGYMAEPPAYTSENGVAPVSITTIPATQNVAQERQNNNNMQVTQASENIPDQGEGNVTSQ